MEFKIKFQALQTGLVLQVLFEQTEKN